MAIKSMSFQEMFTAFPEGTVIRLESDYFGENYDTETEEVSATRQQDISGFILLNFGEEVKDDEIC